MGREVQQRVPGWADGERQLGQNVLFLGNSCSSLATFWSMEVSFGDGEVRRGEGASPTKECGNSSTAKSHLPDPGEVRVPEPRFCSRTQAIPSTEEGRALGTVLSSS